MMIIYLELEVIIAALIPASELAVHYRPEREGIGEDEIRVKEKRTR